jgi:hypothetical protein
MDNYKLTVFFSDGEVTVEKFVTQQGMERAMRSWEAIAAEDCKNGETYTITKMETEELAPAES